MKNLASAVRVSLCALGAMALAVSAAGRRPDPDHDLVGRGATALPEGPRPRREAARHRRAPALRAGRGQGPELRAGPARPRQHRGHGQGVLRRPRPGRSSFRPRLPSRSGCSSARSTPGAKGEPARQQDCLTKLVAGRARRRARAQPARAGPTSAARTTRRPSPSTRRRRHQPAVLAALQPDGLRAIASWASTRRRSRPSRSTSS